MSSSAATGEILISEEAYVAHLNLDSLEKRHLTLKSKAQPMSVYGMSASS